MSKTILPPVHTSFETAYVVADYPYGFNLRTDRRIWIETNKSKEQRVVSCTRNPKVAGEKWNAPKKGVYHMVAVLYVENETGYIKSDATNRSEQASEFLAEYADGLTDWHKGKLMIFDALHRAQDETNLSMYGATSEQRETIWNRAKEILTSEGHADIAKKIA